MIELRVPLFVGGGTAAGDEEGVLVLPVVEVCDVGDDADGVDVELEEVVCMSDELDDELGPSSMPSSIVTISD